MERMSKCWYCNNELTTGDNPKHFGICNKCYDEMFKSRDTIIRSLTDKIAELQKQLEEKEKEIRQLDNEKGMLLNNSMKLLKEKDDKLKSQPAEIVEKIKELEKELEILLIENKNLKFTSQKLPQMIDNFNKPVRVDVQGIIDCYMNSLDRLEALQKIKNRWKEMYYNLDEKYKKLKQSKKNKP